MSAHNQRLATAVAVAAAALTLVPSASAKSKAFNGKFAGTASVLVNGSAVTVKSVNGSGGAAGLTKLSGHNGTGTASGSCAFFSGKALLQGPSGKVALAVKSTSKGCGSETAATVTGSATAKGLSGKLKGTKGAVTFSGTFDSSTGAFSIVMKGKV